MSMMCFPVCGSPDRRRAVVLVDDDADVTFADASDVFFDARDAFDARASALSSDQPMMRDVEDDHDDDDGTFAALSRASERMERESRSNLAARARATATAIKAVLNAAASKKSIDLTSFLGTPIRWCSRYSVLRIATDSVSPISKDMPSRTFRMFEMLAHPRRFHRGGAVLRRSRRLHRRMRAPSIVEKAAQSSARGNRHAYDHVRGWVVV